jgi:hypothetical protein
MLVRLTVVISVCDVSWPVWCATIFYDVRVSTNKQYEQQVPGYGTRATCYICWLLYAES